MNGECIAHLTAIGIEYHDAVALRRISMQLRTWYERECGTDNGCIERDEETGIAYWLNSHTMRRFRIPDREHGAEKRLAAIMAKYPKLTSYLQTDPRGASLYILRPGDVPKGERADGYYTRGIAVYK